MSLGKFSGLHLAPLIFSRRERGSRRIIIINLSAGVAAQQIWVNCIPLLVDSGSYGTLRRSPLGHVGCD